MIAKARPEIDHALIKALAHPWRFQALHILNQQVASPKELAPMIGAPLGGISYHCRELQKAGCVELVRTEPRRGATEHFYRAIKRASFSDDEWVELPESVRGSIAWMQFLATGKLVSAALESGSFERRPDRHHSLHECLVDEQGWSDAMALLAETMERMQEIEATSGERLLESGAEPIPMAVSVIGFERA